MAVVEGFELLTRGYLGQDWELSGPTIDDAIISFVRDEAVEDVVASIAGFEDLLASPMTDDEYYERWVLGLCSGYDPRYNGMSYREWFAHALEVLRAAASARPPESPS